MSENPKTLVIQLTIDETRCKKEGCGIVDSLIDINPTRPLGVARGVCQQRQLLKTTQIDNPLFSEIGQLNDVEFFECYFGEGIKPCGTIAFGTKTLE